jgi:hypothetical protein
MTAAAGVDPIDRPKLTISEAGALQGELVNERIKPERRAEIRMTLELARDRAGVALGHGEPHYRLLFNLCRDVLIDDDVRQMAAQQRAHAAGKAAEREERRLLVEGRQGRFSALPGSVQVAMYAEGQAKDARAGWKAYGEALVLQVAGTPIPVPWVFETELLNVGQLRKLERQGLVDNALVEEAERRCVIEGSPW